MRRTPIGIDIGEYSIKCAVLKKIGETYCVRHKQVFYTSDNTNRLIFSAWLKEILDEFIKEHRILFPVLYFTLPHSAKNMVRICNMPKLSRSELTKSMRFEVEEKTWVQDLSTVDYQWSVLNEGDGLDVLVAIFNKEMSQEIRSSKHILWSLGGIEPQSISLTRLIHGDTVVIDFGHTGTRLMAHKNGKLFKTQAIDIGGQHITTKIEQGKALLSTEKASMTTEELKHKFAAVLLGNEEIESDPDVLQLADLITEPVEKITRELKQALIKLKIDGFEPKEAYYTGDSSRLKYFTQHVEHELQLGLQPLNLTDEGEEEDDDYMFMVASGAWLRRDFPVCPQINFAEEKPAADPTVFLVAALGFALLLQAGVYSLHRQTGEILKESQIELSRLENISSNLEAKIAEEIQITQYYNKQIDTVKSIKRQKVWASDILYELPYKTLSGITIKKIQINQGSVDLYGTSQNYSEIGFFAYELEELGHVEIAQINNGIEENDFHIKLRAN